MSFLKSDISAGDRVTFTGIYHKDETLELSNVARMWPSLKYIPGNFQSIHIIKLLDIDFERTSLVNNYLIYSVCKNKVRIRHRSKAFNREKTLLPTQITIFSFKIPVPIDHYEGIVYLNRTIKNNKQSNLSKIVY